VYLETCCNEKIPPISIHKIPINQLIWWIFPTIPASTQQSLKLIKKNKSELTNLQHKTNMWMSYAWDMLPGKRKHDPSPILMGMNFVLPHKCIRASSI
jgi:hypothetical protein